MRLKTTKARAYALGGLCFAILAWNIALSSRRQYYDGYFVTVEEKDVEVEVNCPGKLEPRVQHVVRSEIGGTRKVVYVKEGDEVKAGQLLMEISDDQVRIELKQKRQELRSAGAEYERAESDLTLERKLFNQGAVARKEVDSARMALEKAAQALSMAKDELDNLSKKIKGTSVVSPIDGIVIQSYVENELSIPQNNELFRVAQLDHFSLKGRVDELDIAQVEVGQDAKIKCDAFPGTQLSGKVASIGVQAAEGAFAEIEVKLDIEDDKGLKLKPNLSCDGSIVAGRIPHGLVIPSSGLRQGKKGPYVLRERLGGWLTKEDVVIERQSMGQAIVKGGLKSGDRVLIPN